jgi:phosphatidylserine/phosphatidylglycerophosphate/cardiolipin synthase-like enzyme
MFNDLVVMNNFVVKALEEASMDNFMLMPYFDMLQFYESLKEQVQVGKHVRLLYDEVRKMAKGIVEPLKVSLKAEEIEEIELQALRVKLISNSLKNPKKDHRRLETEYQEKAETA